MEKQNTQANKVYYNLLALVCMSISILIIIIIITIIIIIIMETLFVFLNVQL